MQVEEILKDILTKHHTNAIKREIHNYTRSWNFACPICGDSHKNTSKKRGHLYKKNLFYVCYNCGVRLPFTEFLEHLNTQIDPESLFQINQQIADWRDTTTVQQEEMKFFSLQKKISLSTIADFLNRNPKYRLRKFQPVVKDSIVWKYLTQKRKIFNLTDFYEAEYQISVDKNMWQPVMVSLNRQADILLGFQWRNLEESKDRRKFKIYNWQECWEFYNEKLTDDEYRPYNKISYIYNILNVDPDLPITIFEGFIDSQFVPNSVALVGVNTDYSFMLQDDLKIRFFFDNDKDGNKKTVELINKGFSVFLWNKFFKDFARQSPTPDISYHKMKEKIKDLNQLARKIHNPYYNLELENYFAKDKLDIMDL